MRFKGSKYSFYERTDANGNIIIEQYDNLQGDKPSCYSGVKRRLFQSVMGHPLLTFLTLDGIKQALIRFMRTHFEESIKENRDALGVAWAHFCATGVCEPCWDALNASPAQQAAFLSDLAQEYKTEFTNYPAFIKYVNNSFVINQIYPAHVVRFAGETHLGDLFPTSAIGITTDEPAQRTITTPLNHPAVENITTRLSSCGALGQCMNDELRCLARGTQSPWPVWAGANEKLTAILAELNHQSTPLTETVLRGTLEDKESTLYQALKQKPTADRTFRDKIDAALNPEHGLGASDFIVHK